MNIFDTRDHPDGDGFNLLLEAGDIQDASLDLMKAQLRILNSTIPQAGAEETLDLYEERLRRETDDYNRKRSRATTQPQLFSKAI